MNIVFEYFNKDLKRLSAMNFENIIEANRLQQIDFATAWGRKVAEVRAVGGPAPVAGELRVPLTFRPTDKSIDPDGAVAYHSVDENGNPFGVVLTDVVEEEVMNSGMSFIDCASIGASHEGNETVEDLYGKDWSDLPGGLKTPQGDAIPEGCQEAHEACDRVQSESYGKEVGTPKVIVQVSNFLLPTALGKDVATPGEKYDYMGLLASPRDILPDKGDGRGGGYMIVRAPGGQEVQVLGCKRSALKYSHHTLKNRGVDVEALRASLAA